uniref:Focal adhesion kinase isoform 2 n=1 Tax=Ephydatia muelleri TaxID=6052 RepID=A0A481MTK0_EPHMU|nr:focal adhesion kinase isoform 2 [Ephydatia muelleri]
MSRFVDSFRNFFNRDKCSKAEQPSRRPNNRVTHADSFVFLPAEDGTSYWGEPLRSGKRENVPATSNQSRDCESPLRRRTKTVAAVDEQLIRSGTKPFARRLSGTLVALKSRRSDEVVDESMPEESAEEQQEDDPSRVVNPYDTLASHSYASLEPPFGKRAKQQDSNLSWSGSVAMGPERLLADGQIAKATERVSADVRHYATPWQEVDRRVWERLQWLQQQRDDYAEVKEHRSSLSQFGATILPKDVQVGERIGEGQFGDVHKGVLFPQTTGEQVVAIKTCKPEASDVERAKFLEEAAIMAKFNHRHIIKLFGVMSHDSTTYIIMELALIGQLRRYLMTEGAHIAYPILLQYICQLCSAVVYLESKNFVHRDIAARNVLLATPELIKLADFGLSKRLEDTDYYVASKGKLPIKWMAPESINFRKFTGLSDVWMFGVCCWEILMKGVKPFVGVKNDEVINMIEMGQRLPLPPDCPAPLFDLLNQCWQYDAQDRPTFAKLEHMLMAIVEQERLEQPRKTNSSGSSARQDPYAVIRQDGPEKPPRRDQSSSSIHGRGAQESSVRWSGFVPDEPPPPPPPRLRETDDSHLRLNERFRGTSGSPNGDIGSPPLEPAPYPPKPPRTDSPGSRDRIRPPDRPTPAPIVPYSVTTITPSDPTPPSFPVSPTYPVPEPRFNGAIPPPSILRPAASRLSGDHERVGYYSVPAEAGEGPMGRVLSEDGTFVDKYGANKRGASSSSSRLSTSSLTSQPEPKQPEPAERELDEFDDENDELLKQTTDVVRAVMEMSNKVPISRPADYVELVKNVGKALREFLTKVEMVQKTLPIESHNEIIMANKVLSSDVTRLVDAMRDAQKNYQTFLEQEYQKQMLKAGHIIAVNAKQLLDTVNSARRKVLRTPR